MQIIHQTQPMPIPFRPRREPATAETEPVTDASVQRAREAQRRDRESLTREIGITFVNDMPVLPSRLDQERTTACGEAIDAAVEEFGMEAVLRAVHAVAAMNGRSL